MLNAVKHLLRHACGIFISLRGFFAMLPRMTCYELQIKQAVMVSPVEPCVVGSPGCLACGKASALALRRGCMPKEVFGLLSAMGRTT
ncbi:MAG: hypothetical protein JWP44_1556 [Mucilaginibacter sp.]|nr:hypothetical protein [Mucilaginibacter sp.]